MVLTNHPIEALESINFGIYPILITDKKTKLDGEYFLLQHNNDWIEELQKLLVTIKNSEGNIYSLDTLINNNKCFKPKDDIRFINDDGKIYEGKIEKLSISFPVRIFRIIYIDCQQNTTKCLKQ